MHQQAPAAAKKLVVVANNHNMHDSFVASEVLIIYN